MSPRIRWCLIIGVAMTTFVFIYLENELSSLHKLTRLINMKGIPDLPLLKESSRCDPGQCTSLLTKNGTWVKNRWFSPGGCQLHRYSKRSIRQCMENRAKVLGFSHIAVVGDSRARDTFQQLASYFEIGLTRTRPQYDYNYTYPDLKLKLEFRWNPFLDIKHTELYEFWTNQSAGLNGKPDLVIDSIAAWMLVHWTKRNLPTFKIYKEVFKHKFASVLKSFMRDGQTQLLWKLQDPARFIKGYPNRDNFEYYRFNKVANETLHNLHENIVVWSSSVGVANHFKHDKNIFADGLHYVFPSPCQDLNVQLLINYYCNAYMEFEDARGMCCC